MDETVLQKADERSSLDFGNELLRIAASVIFRLNKLPHLNCSLRLFLQSKVENEFGFILPFFGVRTGFLESGTFNFL